MYPLPPASEADRVAEETALEISRGEFGPGQRLESIASAAKRFGASERAVRQARRKLVDAAVITVRRGAPTQVNPAQMWRVSEPLGRIARQEMDPETHEIAHVDWLITARGAFLSAHDPQPQALARLEEAIHQHERIALITPVDRASREYDILDQRIHRLIVEMSGDPGLQAIIAPFHELALEDAIAARRTWEDIRLDLAEHLEIFAAIRDAEPARAERAMWLHMIDHFERRAERGAWLDPVKLPDSDEASRP